MSAMISKIDRNPLSSEDIYYILEEENYFVDGFIRSSGEVWRFYEFYEGDLILKPQLKRLILHYMRSILYISNKISFIS